MPTILRNPLTGQRLHTPSLVVGKWELGFGERHDGLFLEVLTSETATCRAGALEDKQPFYQRVGQVAGIGCLPNLQA